MQQNIKLPSIVKGTMIIDSSLLNAYVGKDIAFNVIKELKLIFQQINSSNLTPQQLVQEAQELLNEAQELLKEAEKQIQQQLEVIEGQLEVIEELEGTKEHWQIAIGLTPDLEHHHHQNN